MNEISDLLDAADKMSQIDTLQKIMQQALERDTRKGFEKVLNAVPDFKPVHPYDAVK
ncbi:MAG: hypothetical protein HOP17_16185 [Acidobacteria bacterium]|nr:hypothetical protein [Acidobacteriota bacterium]